MKHLNNLWKMSCSELYALFFTFFSQGSLYLNVLKVLTTIEMSFLESPCFIVTGLQISNK